MAMLAPTMPSAQPGSVTKDNPYSVVTTPKHTMFVGQRLAKSTPTVPVMSSSAASTITASRTQMEILTQTTPIRLHFLVGIISAYVKPKVEPRKVPPVTHIPQMPTIHFLFAKTQPCVTTVPAVACVKKTPAVPVT
jgi:hypothetical protein